ncbi:NAD(+) synthase [bacterium]|nr:NAD(+) synthase [bacterium]
MDTKKISEYNRNPNISDWFKNRLDILIEDNVYHNNISELSDKLIKGLTDYRIHWGLENVVIGMSGGIDSAVTASLFKEAGWNVTGCTLPIHQVQAETDRGREACEKLDIEHKHIDLTEGYEQFRMLTVAEVDKLAGEAPQGIDLSSYDLDTRKRLGNIRARLRMITLYNLASLKKGIVASTDNFSELAAGFWTLHGDVGDVAPIQSLTKSWEVPALAELLGVPSSIISAKPTDGLGVGNGDEDQFGFSYLEFDIALFSLLRSWDNTHDNLEKGGRDESIVENVKQRIASTTFKRLNPVNLNHPLDQDRYSDLERLDDKLRR